METDLQRPTRREDAVPTIDTTVAALDLARNNSNIGTAKAIFRSATDLLATTRVCPHPSATIGFRLRVGQDSTPTVNKLDFVELCLFCADICRTLDRGTSGRSRDELNPSIHGAIGLLAV